MINLQWKIKLSLLKSLCGTSIFSFFALFAYFWWILLCPYWQIENEINSCPSDFFLTCHVWQCCFLLILCLSLLWSIMQLIVYIKTFVAAQWSLLTMKDKLLIGLSPLLIHNATQKWIKLSKNHDFLKNPIFLLNRNFKAK